MVSLKLFLVVNLIFFLSGCPFDDNREVEKKLTESEIGFHNLYNQENFHQIYVETDDELKNNFAEQQFISYLEYVKSSIGEVKQKPIVWIDDELNDGIKRLFIRRTKVSNVKWSEMKKLSIGKSLNGN